MINTARRAHIASWCHRVIFMGLVVLAVAAPLLFGSVHTWSLSAVLAALWLLLGLHGVYIWAQSGEGAPNRWRIYRTPNPLTVVWMLALVFVGLQVLPLPASWVEWLSPRAFFLNMNAAATVDADPPSLMVLSLHPWATRVQWLALAGWAGAFVLALHHLAGRREMAAMLLAWCLVAAFEGIYGMLQAGAGVAQVWWWHNPFAHGRATGTFVYTNHYAAYLLLSCLVCLGWLLARMERLRHSSQKVTGRKRLVKIIEDQGLLKTLGLAGACLAMAGGLLVSGSRGGMLALAAGLGALIWLARRSPGASMRKAAVALMAALALMAVLLGLGAGSRFQWAGHGMEKRLTLNQGALAMSTDFPLTGSGWGSFQEVYPLYKPLWAASALVNHAHNEWLELTAEAGWPAGLTAMAALVWFLWAAARRRNQRRSSFSRQVCAGCVVATAAVALHGMIDFVFRAPALALAYSFALAMAWVACNPGLRLPPEARRPPVHWDLPRWLGIPLALVLAGMFLVYGVQLHRHYQAQELIRTLPDSITPAPPVTVGRLARALELAPDDAGLWQRLSHRLVSRRLLPGERSRADEFAQNRLGLRPGTPLAVTAAAAASRALRASPANPAHYAALAGLLGADPAQRGRARDLYAQAVNLEPRNPTWYYQWGLYLWWLGDKYTAKPLFEEAVKLDRRYRPQVERILKMKPPSRRSRR